MRIGLALIACVLLSGCRPVPSDMLPPATAYVHFNDKVAALMLRWGIRWRFPCRDAQRDDECFKFTQPERMRGLWRNNFEGSEFCEVSARQCPDPNSENDQKSFVWLALKPPAGWADTPPGGLYKIDFIGRRSQFGGMFGHFGMSRNEVLVDRLISIELTAPPPAGQMTKEPIGAYLHECAGKHMCMPNSEVDRQK